MINELVDDYSRYVKVDLQKELEPVVETIEDMLTRLEEFESLMDMVRSGGTKCLNGTIPEILSRQGELQVVCERVDNMERFVARVKQDLAAIETQMEAAESDLSISDSSFKNIFKPLFFKKTEPATVRSPGHYDAPELFSTSSFFPPQEHENL